MSALDLRTVVDALREIEGDLRAEATRPQAEGREPAPDETRRINRLFQAADDIDMACDCLRSVLYQR